ncbi:hypothetical protein PINS_up023599 [Pythium insidiosum]|nr:hypothetical protein PINS_up023599 [Pythium insidiosum]
MLDICRDVVRRETTSLRSLKDVVIPTKDAWCRQWWSALSYRIRSSHMHLALSEYPKSLEAAEAKVEYQLGVYETPAPGRFRKSLDYWLPGAPEVVTVSTPSQHQQNGQIDSPRKRMSMALEAHTQTGSFSEEGTSLLQQVGRVVAEQGGGEIHDITLDQDVQDGEVLTTAPTEPDSPRKDHMHPPRDKVMSSIEKQQASDADANANPPDTLQPSPLVPNGTVSRTWEIENFRHQDTGIDPGEGVAVFRGEQVLGQARCRRVIAEGVVLGTLLFTTECLVFVPSMAHHAVAHGDTSLETGVAGTTEDAADETAPGLRRCWRWKYKYIVGVFLRRYRLCDSAFEIFLRNGSNHFLDFPRVVKQQRNELALLLYSFLARGVPKQFPRKPIPNLGTIVKAWQNRQISNYDYLMALNTFAGRSFNDLTQYPVFPWVLSNYVDETLDLNDPQNYRDLSKPMGALNPDRLNEYWERYHSFDDPVIPKFLYGSHYSTCAGVVLFFLFRVQPFADLHRKMQGNGFDLPDRLFHSIKETWQMCNSRMAEVKELTPEFYSDASFLRNLNGYKLGKRHDQKLVGDVELPPWAKGSAEEFVRINRLALESDYVSQRIHEWIDLIFGFKQRGKEALKANNVFYYLTYYGVVDLDRVEDPFLRESMELQIAHFGQCPMQLFTTPHPKRQSSPKESLFGSKLSVQQQSQNALDHQLQPGNRSPVGQGLPPLQTAIVRPLALMFQDVSEHAQERRQRWSPPIVVRPVAKSAIRWIKIFPDRMVTVNDLGVVELYNWKLLAKPEELLGQNNNGPNDTTLTGQVEVGSSLSTSKLSVDESGSTIDNDPKDESASGEDATKTDDPDASRIAVCPWVLEVCRDDSPFDFVPRIPVFDDGIGGQGFSLEQRGFPIASSSNGRVIISGGARNGSLQLRLLDLDNGHVLAKGSVSGHDDAVTCISVDRFFYHAPSGQSDTEDLVVSGSRDCTLAAWRLTRVKPDMMFRLPRISACPIARFRGHTEEVVDCSASMLHNVIVSCSSREVLVHFIHDDGAVAFRFSANAGDEAAIESDSRLSSVRVSTRGFVIGLVHSKQRHTGRISSSFIVYTLSGVFVRRQTFEDQLIHGFRLSREGDLVILTIANRVRICRMDDFVVVQEYASPPDVTTPISCCAFGPDEATILLVTGHTDGSAVVHLLPDADGTVTLLGNLRRLLGVNSKLKMVKGTMQQAQTLALSTLGSAKAATNTARDIAGEALGEAKSIMKGFMSFLRTSSQ